MYCLFIYLNCNVFHLIHNWALFRLGLIPFGTYSVWGLFHAFISTRNNPQTEQTPNGISPNRNRSQTEQTPIIWALFRLGVNLFGTYSTEPCTQRLCTQATKIFVMKLIFLLFILISVKFFFKHAKVISAENKNLWTLIYKFIYGQSMHS